MNAEPTTRESADPLAAESEIPICSDFADSTWDEEFMAEIGPHSKEVCEHDEEDCDQDGPEDVEPPPPRLKNLREVMECLEDVRSLMVTQLKKPYLVNAVAWL